MFLHSLAISAIVGLCFLVHLNQACILEPQSNGRIWTYGSSDRYHIVNGCRKWIPPQAFDNLFLAECVEENAHLVDICDCTYSYSFTAELITKSSDISKTIFLHNDNKKWGGLVIEHFQTKPKGYCFKYGANIRLLSDSEFDAYPQMPAPALAA